MKILHVLCDLSGGGAERMVLDLCRYSTVEASVATVHSGGALADAFAAAEVTVSCLGRSRGRPGLRATARLVRLAVQADVVHTHLWAGDFWGRPAGVLARRPVITTEHNTRADSGPRRRIWTAMAPLSERIVCVSQAASRTLQHSGVCASQLTVIENGIDLERFSQRPLASERRIVAVGRLTRQKGFDVLVDALRGIEASTTILGEGEERGALERRAAGLSIALPGWVSDIRPYLAQAAVLVIPSRWEGFGLIAAEAMASGVPVIASRVDGLVEVVGDAGILVPPEDAGALREAMTRLLGDPALRERLRERGLSRAPRFSIQRTVARYEALYRTLSPG